MDPEVWQSLCRKGVNSDYDHRNYSRKRTERSSEKLTNTRSCCKMSNRSLMSSRLLHFSVRDHSHAFGGADLLTLIDSTILSYTSFTVPANTKWKNLVFPQIPVHPLGKSHWTWNQLSNIKNHKYNRTQAGLTRTKHESTKFPYNLQVVHLI